jgi:periplasmic protein TonB
MRHERSASASASSSAYSSGSGSGSGSDSGSSARRFWLLALASAAAAVVSACKTAPGDSSAKGPSPQPDAAGVTGPVTASRGSARNSNASTSRAYRADGASHLYGLNANRIYKGKMPPLLYAVGVMNVEIDGTGKVTRLEWMRAPRHAPEVMAEIERTIRQASPFPAPTRLGKVVYTDTWLWHVSGKFQLDTLTEGQM